MILECRITVCYKTFVRFVNVYLPVGLYTFCILCITSANLSDRIFSPVFFFVGYKKNHLYKIFLRALSLFLLSAQRRSFVFFVVVIIVLFRDKILTC